ncbi:MAG: TIR domain-containing protein [Deltaproteobacteria bacterium]|nr:TIR domain-containing protein [Deltaproteobacteria bacterium]
MTAAPEVLTVHVAFHPACPESGAHARALFRLLHGAGLEEPSCWSPIPVRYLCGAAALDGWCKVDDVGFIGDHAVLVVMVSDQMLVDGAWRKALNGIKDGASAPNKPHRVILPVMLSGAMSLLEPFQSRFDPVRVWHRDDKDLPVLPAAPRPAADPFALLPGVDPARQQLALELRAKAEAHTQEEKKAKDARTKWMDRRFDRLRRGFLDALLRCLRLPAGLQAPPPNGQTGPTDHPSTATGDRLVVFLSHAKADGDDIAQWLRDGLGRVSRLQTWYDQNDLRAGAPAAQRMREAAKSCTGGLIAVHSTAYGTRPWCRIEAEAARRPERIDLHWGNESRVVLLNQPGVAISQFGHGAWGRGVEALARLPTIGWPGPDPKTEELDAATALVVDRLLLELLQQRRFLLQVEAATPRPGEVFLAFTPDTWTLTEAVRVIEEPKAGAKPTAKSKAMARTLVYPGGGLTTGEAKAANTRLAAMRKGWTLVDFEHREQPAPPPKAAGKWLALSAGGLSKELYPAGVGEEHINALAIALTRMCALMGWGVAYGGTLSSGLKENHVRALLETARAWRQDETDHAAQDTPPRRRFIRNYVAVGHHGGCTPAVRAEVLDICSFILVDSPPHLRPAGQASTWDLKLDPLANPSAYLERTCGALSEMRRVSTAETDARVLVGGKLKGWSGWLPGVAEELMCSVTTGQPTLLLSGFGGVAGKLGDYLAGAAGAWPEELTFAYHDSRRSSQPEDQAAWTPTARERQRGRFGELKRALEIERSLFKAGTSSVTVIDTRDLRQAVEEVQWWLSSMQYNPRTQGVVEANVRRDDLEAGCPTPFPC